MLSALIALSLFAASDDPEGVIATAPGGVQSVAVGAVVPVIEGGPAVSLQNLNPHGLSTAQQIDLWVAQRAAGDRPFDDGRRDPFAFRDDRKVHGEVSASVGTRDYSAFGARVSIPFGEGGRVDLSYRQSRNAPWGYGYGYGADLLDGYDSRSIRGYRSYDDPFLLGEDRLTIGSTLRGSRDRETRVPDADEDGAPRPLFRGGGD